MGPGYGSRELPGSSSSSWRNSMSQTPLAEERSGGVDRAIRASTVVVVLAVAGVAAYISYWHAYAVVREYAESGVTALLEPATIDGLVYASSMVILYAARHRLPVPPLARWMLALGIAASLAVNLAQGWSHGVVGAVVAAWPAVALIGSYELLAWMIRTAAAREADRVPEGDRRVPRADQPDHIGEPGCDVPDRADHVGGSQMPGDVGGVSGINVAAVAAYRASVMEGKPLSERRLAEAFGTTSRRWARNRIAEARQSAPGLIKQTTSVRGLSAETAGASQTG
jgi:Protein of unknown function (DUF2637)